MTVTVYKVQGLESESSVSTIYVRPQLPHRDFRLHEFIRSETLRGLKLIVYQGVGVPSATLYSESSSFLFQRTLSRSSISVFGTNAGI
jgi:hypothetical protein